MSKGEWAFAFGFVLMAVGGALSQFVMIGLLGCLMLLAAWMCVVMGAAFAADRKSGTAMSVVGSILVGAAGLALAVALFGLTNIPASIAVEKMRSGPQQTYTTDWIGWSAALFVAAALFAVGLGSVDDWRRFGIKGCGRNWYINQFGRHGRHAVHDHG